MSEKLEQLGTIAQLLDEFMESHDSREMRIADLHPVIYSGNPDSNIMVVNLCPDRCELSRAIQDNVNDKYVCFGPNGNYFRDKARRGGFDPETDFFYVNMVPYYPIGGEEYTHETINKFLWVIQGMIELINPTVIITIGYKVLQSMFPDITREQFRLLIYKNKNHKKDQRLYQFLELDEYILVPLESPDKLELENLHNFYTENLARLYLKVPFLKKDTQ